MTGPTHLSLAARVATPAPTSNGAIPAGATAVSAATSAVTHRAAAATSAAAANTAIIEGVEVTSTIAAVTIHSPHLGGKSGTTAAAMPPASPDRTDTAPAPVGTSVILPTEAREVTAGAAVIAATPVEMTGAVTATSRAATAEAATARIRLGMTEAATARIPAAASEGDTSRIVEGSASSAATTVGIATNGVGPAATAATSAARLWTTSRTVTTGSVQVGNRSCPPRSPVASSPRRSARS